MKAATFIFGILAALFVGLVAALTVGQVVAVIALVFLLALSVYAFWADEAVLRGLLTVVVAAFVGSLAFIGWVAFTLIQAFGNTSGPVDPPNVSALASAEAKFDSLENSAAFRLELTEQELSAVIQDGLAENPEHGIRRIDIDIVDVPNQQGEVNFAATFKNSGLMGEGAVTAILDSGSVNIELRNVDLGALQLPGLAEGAMEDLIESISDLNDILERNRADVQLLEIGDDRILVVGTQASTDLITADTLLDGLRDQAAAAGAGVTPPPERLGPGTAAANPGIDANPVGTSPFLVALGDSLAANVGVGDPTDGYVSRLHRQLEIADGTAYGLRNFGISGETTGTMIRSGQLDAAVDFMKDVTVQYVTIDIGANDLLGHLGSDDCADTLQAPACQVRFQQAFATYPDNLNRIFDEIQDAAPDAAIIFMKVYNPFALGFGVGLEAESNQIITEFNDIAAGIAESRGILVADAFTPMNGTAGATTHMLDPNPDIHPTDIGFDILACSFLEALGHGCPVG